MPSLSLRVLAVLLALSLAPSALGSAVTTGDGYTDPKAVVYAGIGALPRYHLPGSEIERAMEDAYYRVTADRANLVDVEQGREGTTEQRTFQGYRLAAQPHGSEVLPVPSTFATVEDPTSNFGASGPQTHGSLPQAGRREPPPQAPSPSPPDSGIRAALSAEKPLDEREHAQRSAIASTGSPPAQTTTVQVALAFALFAALAAAYARIRGSKVLAHEQRSQILAILEAEPGVTVSDLARRVGVHRTVVKFHLRVLEREDFARFERVGRTLHCYAAGAKRDATADASMLSETSKRLVATVSSSPGIGLTELASRLGVSRVTVHYHVTRLARVSILTSVRTPTGLALYARSP